MCVETNVHCKSQIKIYTLCEELCVMNRIKKRNRILKMHITLCAI